MLAEVADNFLTYFLIIVISNLKPVDEFQNLFSPMFIKKGGIPPFNSFTFAVQDVQKSVSNNRLFQGTKSHLIQARWYQSSQGAG